MSGAPASRGNNATICDRLAKALIALGIDPNDEAGRGFSEKFRDNLIGFFLCGCDMGYKAPEGSGEVTPVTLPFGVDAIAINTGKNIGLRLLNASETKAAVDFGNSAHSAFQAAQLKTFYRQA